MESPRTFSSSSARGPMTPHSSTAQANKSRSSVAPSCLPAMVKGGHGTPPASRSVPAYSAGFHTSGLATSPWAIFQCGGLCLRVAHASASSSTDSSCSNPASSSPSDCPPAPAQTSTTPYCDTTTSLMTDLVEQRSVRSNGCANLNLDEDAAGDQGVGAAADPDRAVGAGRDGP